jgi:hypothetical protein
MTLDLATFSHIVTIGLLLAILFRPKQTAKERRAEFLAMHCAGFRNDSDFPDEVWAAEIVGDGIALFDAIDACGGK